MNHRLLATILLLLSLAVILFGYLLLQKPELLGLCDPSLRMNCLSEFWRYGIAKPLYWSMWLLPILFFVLIFVRRDVFFSWLKFFVLLVPVPLLLIINAEPIPSGFFSGPFPDRTQMTALMVKFVVLASALFIVFKYVRIFRRKNDSPPKM